jgi:hypothetical protein
LGTTRSAEARLEYLFIYMTFTYQRDVPGRWEQKEGCTSGGEVVSPSHGMPNMPLQLDSMTNSWLPNDVFNATVAAITSGYT